MNSAYPTDLNDDQWDLFKALLPTPQTDPVSGWVEEGY
jgi:transposase